MNLYRSDIYSFISLSYEKKALARSLLFSGPSYSGRLSLAMDMARMIGINDIIFLPERNFSIPLDAHYNLLREKYSSRFINKFINICSLILMQYHPAFQKEGTDGSKDKLFSLASDINQELMELREKDSDDMKNVMKLASSIYSSISKSEVLYRGKKKESALSVDDVRSIQGYVSHLASKCMVIIENIEDSTESARNALLKILEEPPEECYFVLISKNSMRILTTILSRLRKINFSPLTNAQLNDYLKTEYLQSKNFDSYESFLFEMSTEEKDRESVINSADVISKALIDGHKIELSTLEEAFADLDKNPSFFISMVLKNVESAFLSGKVRAKKGYSILKSIDSAYLSYSVYNQNIKSALDCALREESFVH